jgi:hypothetical protein
MKKNSETRRLLAAINGIKASIRLGMVNAVPVYMEKARRSAAIIIGQGC